jgi:hypothetical protein
MGAVHAQGLHEGGHIVGKGLRRVDAFRLIALAGTSQVAGDTGEVLEVLGNLEGIAGVISGQVGNQDQRLSDSLLIVVHGDTVRFDPGHYSRLR